MDFVSPVSPPVSARMLQCLPSDAPLVQSADSSVAISPNRVRSDSTPDIVDTGPVFEVSLWDTTGLLMRPSGAAVQAPLGSLPGSDYTCAPVLGEPVAFALSGPIPGLHAPAITFPVYPLPSGLALLPVSRSAQTVLASGVSSLDVPRTRDVSQEGPFDAYCSPMDTGDCPLVATGLPGCPYRITSYTNQLLILIRRLGFSYITPGSWSSSGLRNLLGCCTVLQPFGFSIWMQRMLWRPL